MADQKKTSGLAIASLVLGILSLPLLGPLGSLPAIIMGHVARSKIKKDPDALTGAGLALAGLIIGYIQVVITILYLAIAIPAFSRARDTTRESKCINNMRQIEAAKDVWALKTRKASGDNVDIQAVNEYIKGERTPDCPAGGTYEYHPIDSQPECSVHGVYNK